ncbi:MAG: hypothetical protein HOV66_18825 [Streptomycetaceae bacterium]|nr:hypothetical protein [Streptomycetaceae bacterium]
MKVDTVSLRAASTHATMVGYDLRPAGDAMGPATLAAGDRMPGFAGVQAFTAIAMAWGAQIDYICTGYEQAGTDLTNSAASYDTAESANQTVWQQPPLEHAPDGSPGRI